MPGWVERPAARGGQANVNGWPLRPSPLLKACLGQTRIRRSLKLPFYPRRTIGIEFLLLSGHCPGLRQQFHCAFRRRPALPAPEAFQLSEELPANPAQRPEISSAGAEPYLVFARPGFQNHQQESTNGRIGQG